MGFGITSDNMNMNVLREDNNSNKITYNWENKLILIAEDEETNFLYLKAALSRTGVKFFGPKQERSSKLCKDHQWHRFNPDGY